MCVYVPVCLVRGLSAVLRDASVSLSSPHAERDVSPEPDLEKSFFALPDHAFYALHDPKRKVSRTVVRIIPPHGQQVSLPCIVPPVELESRETICSSVGRYFHTRAVVSALEILRKEMLVCRDSGNKYLQSHVYGEMLSSPREKRTLRGVIRQSDRCTPQFF